MEFSPASIPVNGEKTSEFSVQRKEYFRALSTNTKRLGECGTDLDTIRRLIQFCQPNEQIDDEWASKCGISVTRGIQINNIVYHCHLR